ncbi:disease resistance protein RGA2-like [Phalaenopsis equestris]|uniref:disease resistance protein RGA2-like n=1 Tax=Phalaenopsis equestris TaxID=78828 RepID=UPI0009E18B49|nr:disease resistance protein RGA2-like [Phalaenopsis equestris]
MATWLVDKMMDAIIDSCLQYLQGRIESHTSVEEELDRLRGYRNKIQDVVSASNQAQIRDCSEALDEWMQRLRDAIDDANDLLEEFQYLGLKEQLARPNVEKTESKKRGFIPPLIWELALKFRRVGDGVLQDDPNLKRLKEVVRNLDKVSTEVSNFFQILKYTEEKAASDDRERGSSPGPVFIGRGREKANVMKRLGEPSNQDPSDTDLYNNISLLSIVGLGGMGKTTLLQHVFEDVKEEFDLKIWVCVSNNFKEEEVITDMLKYLNKWKPHLMKLPALQNTLKFVMQSKKFLLVLDDVWEEGSTTKWGNVLSPLAKGSLGGKILVTTRMDSIASMIAEVIRKKNKMLRLEGLKDDECLQLLKAHAFGAFGAFGVKENSSLVHNELECIAEEIVKKLSGSPLAAKVIGCILKSELTPSKSKHWQRVLNKNIESITSLPCQDKNTILTVLRLSYSILPDPLKNCFAFCGIFPQGHLFDKDDLVRMWIALDFVQPPSNPGDTIEDMGRWYFDTLVKISFFDKKNSTFYTMHDLIHALARDVSQKKCFRFVENKDLSFDIPETIRHLFVDITNLDMLREITKLKHYVRNWCPESIENLIHLRYLNFYRTRIALLPKALCNLYHLQFLIFNSISKWAFSDDFIPEDMNNLSNLRYLKLPRKSFSGMFGHWNLKSLQKLDGFYVRIKNGYKIWELKHSNEICRIQKVRNPRCRYRIYSDEFSFPSDELDYKKNLTNLSLDWGDYDCIDKERSGTLKWGFYERTVEESGTFTNFEHLLTNLQIDKNSRTSRKVGPDSDSDSEVVMLEKLEPPSNIKELLIHGHMGAGFTLWLSKVNSIFNVEYIKLDKCLNWEILPPFGQLPRLKYLYLHNMPKIELLDNKFHHDPKVCTLPSLELLHIENLQVLEVWFDVEAAKDNCLFPCLKKLYLKDCPKLQLLSCLAPKLERLVLNKITWKSFDFLNDNNNCCNILIRNCSNLKNLSRYMASSYELRVRAEVINDPSVLMMEPLRSTKSINLLKIMDCPVISFPYGAEQWFQKVSFIRELKLERLQNLQALPYFSSLEILHIIDVPKLHRLSYIPASLKQLRLQKLEALQDLPSFTDVSSLEILDMIDVPMLQRLSYIPASLKQLSLQKLESLQDLPSFRDVSSLKILHVKDASKLQQLPNIPTSLENLKLEELELLLHLPSLREDSSLKILYVIDAPMLQQLPNIPASLEQ